MGMGYAHVLVPKDPGYRPEAATVLAFLEECLRGGAIAEVATVRVIDHDHPGGSRVGRDISGGRIEISVPSRRDVRDLNAAAPVAGVLGDFSLLLLGRGPGSRPLLPRLFEYTKGGWREFAEAYDLVLGCHVRRQPVSTCDLHEESDDARTAVPFGQLCPPDQTLGLYSHPSTMEVLEVPGAGCASFYIDAAPGRGLFPESDRRDLEHASLYWIEAAERRFGVQFLQGCRWG